MPRRAGSWRTVSTLIASALWLAAAVVPMAAQEGRTRNCTTNLGGQVVCGDLVIGNTLEQYEAELRRRAEEIRAEESEKRVQLERLVALTERATQAEKESLRSQTTLVSGN
jgi:hypothetical protein